MSFWQGIFAPFLKKSAKKSLIKTTTDLKGQKIRTNQNTPKSVSTPHGYSSEYEAVRT